MGEKGITPLAIVAGVVAVIMVVSIGYFIFVPKQPAPSPPVENQPSGEAEREGIPIYFGATEFSIPSEMKSGFGVPGSAACEGYMVDAAVEEVMNWYESQMAGWTLENETTFSPPDRPDTMIGMQFYSKGDNGAFIFFASDIQRMGGATIIGIVTGPWSLVQGYGEFGERPPEGEESIDWGGAYIFTDPKGDFWLGPGSPPQLIEFPPVDLIKIYVTNDNQYLYLKFEMDGTLPILPAVHDDDSVRMINWTVVIDNDQNTVTGEMGGYSGADIAFSFGYDQGYETQMHWYGFYFFYDPYGFEGFDSLDPQTGEPLIDLEAERKVPKIGGGTGENYVAWKATLSKLGLKRGAKINLNVWAEAESDLYHHFARDEAPPQGQWYSNIEIR
jgi:hypothetical protein